MTIRFPLAQACPWCGGPASVEHIEFDEAAPVWIAGCDSSECPLYCLTSMEAVRRCEAEAKWITGRRNVPPQPGLGMS